MARLTTRVFRCASYTLLLRPSMPNASFNHRAKDLLKSLEDSRQLKRFYHLEGPLGPTARIEGIGEVVVLCSNNYLGLASHPEVIEAGRQGLNKYGAGTASV